MTQREALRSYSASSSLREALGQWRSLNHHHDRAHVDSRVALAVAELRAIEAEVVEHTGKTVENLRVLDIGPGQHLMQMAYFAARGNDVVGVDRDVIVQGLDPAGYWRMARSNGLGRVVKTAGRKALGIDRKYRNALEQQAGARSSGSRLTVLHRNAWDTGLPTGSFDFVYSLRAFMHIHEPEPSIDEAVRVLAPGGVMFIDLMPYTGPTGSLDIQVLGGHGGELPPWAHLRPQYQHLVQESAHLNRLPLAEWRRIIAAAMPGSTLLVEPRVDELRPAAERLHQAGELLEFPIDDLVTSSVRVIWQKAATATAEAEGLRESAQPQSAPLLRT